ncbi:HAD domain-containing protein [Ralstonia pseudosolanacearum]
MLSEPTLFVDFDGVLHPFGELVFDEQFRYSGNPRLFCWAPILDQLLRPHPEVRVIVSSDWRRYFDDDNLIKLLGPLGVRFIGVVQSYQASRAEEILIEVQRRALTAWLAIDDHPSVVHACAHEPRFIGCASDSGLSAVTVQNELRTKLALLVPSNPTAATEPEHQAGMTRRPTAS